MQSQDIMDGTSVDALRRIGSASLEYTGILYQNGNRYFSFLRPEYLGRISNNNMIVHNSTIPGHTDVALVDKDTMQEIYYGDFDSLVMRMRYKNYSTDIGHNIVQHFEANFANWEIVPETKKIGEYDCQRARLSINNHPQWDIWFCPDVQILAGPGNIKYPPGLVVEADMIPLKMHYTLQSVDSTSDIPDNVFWPVVFNEHFDTFQTLRKKPTDEQSKKTKKLELLKQDN
ncbi:MAG: GLPGLI family protein [Chitinophagaceae bacterium]